MSTKLTILFYGKKGKTTSDGLIPIYLRITIDGRRLELSTKRYVEASKWPATAGRMTGNSEESRKVNLFLDSLRAKVYDYQQELVREAQPLTLENFRNKWFRISDRKTMIINVFQYNNEQLEKLVGTDFAPGTLERYRTSLQHTVEFMKWKYKVSDMDVKGINYAFLTEYEFWLKTVRKCNQNTTMKYLSNFRKIVNLCRKNGWIEKDPFYGFKMTKVEVEREFLQNWNSRLYIQKFLQPNV